MMRTPEASTRDTASLDGSARVLFDENNVQRLAETYAPCFALILQLRATDEYGDAGQLRRRILDMLDRLRREAQRAGSASEDTQEAQFALVAFLDETILSSNWSEKDHWLAKPLQLELYNRYDAGEEFFHRLDGLRANPSLHAEVLEIYYLCMALGFKGRYLLHDQEKLRNLIEDTYGELSRTPGMQVDALSPHGKPTDQVATEVRSKLPTWVIAVAALVVGLLIYVGMSVYISSTANDTAREIEAVTGVEQVRS